ncbi:hypothetical protein SUGI_0652920 [Cryptomeria japonica]|nr:hypothetical protein SUGI_0652920 [Cryptomeria japonica]
MLNRRAWTTHEDSILSEYIKTHGEGRWRLIPQNTGLKWCGKSCRLRWLNYLRPNIKWGHISPDEEDLILRLHELLGSRVGSCATPNTQLYQLPLLCPEDALSLFYF